MEAQFHGLTISIETGDLARVACDAVVNAANNHLWMGSGVAGALPSRHVIHAAAMGQDLFSDPALVHEATHNALKRAEEAGLAAVAFPALGTGVGGVGFPECAQAMIGAVLEHARAGTSIQAIRFVLFGVEGAEAFKAILSNTDEREEA